MAHERDEDDEVIEGDESEETPSCLEGNEATKVMRHLKKCVV